MSVQQMSVQCLGCREWFSHAGVRARWHWNTGSEGARCHAEHDRISALQREVGPGPADIQIDGPPEMERAAAASPRPHPSPQAPLPEPLASPRTPAAPPAVGTADDYEDPDDTDGPDGTDEPALSEEAVSTLELIFFVKQNGLSDAQLNSMLELLRKPTFKPQLVSSALFLTKACRTHIGSQFSPIRCRGSAAV
ncbi:MAG: hypothetical protein ACK5PF_06200 [bacterium]|jgi:hypothetical protein